MVRIKRMWNHPVAEVVLSPCRHHSFSRFKSSVLKYYLSALNLRYKVDDDVVMKLLITFFPNGSLSVVYLCHCHAVRKTLSYFIQCNLAKLFWMLTCRNCSNGPIAQLQIPCPTCKIVCARYICNVQFKYI